MLVPYVIRQGDFLSKLAHRMSFEADTVWNDPKNASLKKLRTNPNLLAAGDVLYVPKPTRTWLPVNVGATNKFTADPAPLITITIKMMCEDDPIANTDCRLEGYGDPIPLTTGGDGSVTFKVPINLGSVFLVFDDPPLCHEILPGHMDPPDAPAGVALRLANLGYLDDPTFAPERHADALLAFQADAGLPPTGIADDATLAKLVDVHGH